MIGRIFVSSGNRAQCARQVALRQLNILTKAGIAILRAHFSRHTQTRPIASISNA